MIDWNAPLVLTDGTRVYEGNKATSAEGVRILYREDGHYFTPDQNPTTAYGEQSIIVNDDGFIWSTRHPLGLTNIGPIVSNIVSETT